ncbi:DUF3135 domain-containing protein [Shewanella sp. Choline-02u-19]|jgi:hypothetical protein|uniref:DUF3135 domain-containing protein n=1 Tax=unclassified Shewanella TaxID=196818 RepID=UPI000C31D7EA|nr:MULTISPECIES: DUF3135 domain-containing protein [unclassified Shewanella]PKG57327.1 DUF3135 domain-containing protein [Shewanella sp. GutDb-MelDb]PKG75482.1 DUF3135 domain-containing protein [Shewanella sp. GutCb]PKH56097.1 DUF3135 domain-containing protein [Shewanella sp. Bg11-22]PKI27251.1 DUF3135 domain-containing protein [Shewanella sp. Choline-02u-19]
MTKLPDFDQLLWLAENEPSKLDALQKKLNQEVIDESSAASKPKLVSLLDHLEKKLSLCKTPYQRYQIVSSMMYQKLSSLNDVLNHPDEFYQHKATVLTFANGPSQTGTKKVR